jgi:hypothetical protein
MAKEPVATELGNAVYFLNDPGVLKPEDVLSDPAGETVFLPSAGELSGLFQATSSKATKWMFWPDFLP